MKIIKSNHAHRNPIQPQPPRRAFVTTPTQQVVEGGHETESGVGWDKKVSSKYNNYFYLEIRQQDTNTDGKSLKIVSGFCIGLSVIDNLIVSMKAWRLDFCPLYLRPEVIKTIVTSLVPILVFDQTIRRHLNIKNIFTKEVFV